MPVEFTPERRCAVTAELLEELQRLAERHDLSPSQAISVTSTVLGSMCVASATPDRLPGLVRLVALRIGEVAGTVTEAEASACFAEAARHAATVN